MSAMNKLEAKKLRRAEREDRKKNVNINNLGVQANKQGLKNLGYLKSKGHIV